MIDKQYIISKKLKEDGTFRAISAPSDELKDRQRLLLPTLKTFKVHPCVFSYVPGGNVEKFVAPHQHKDLVVSLDLQEFFYSIKASSLIHYLKGLHQFPPYKVTQMVDTCFLNNHLPQGAVTSPIISNVVFYRNDCQLEQLAVYYHGSYSRYADDLLFSFVRPIEKGFYEDFIETVITLLSADNFRLNAKKVKINPLEVAGVQIKYAFHR